MLQLTEYISPPLAASLIPSIFYDFGSVAYIHRLFKRGHWLSNFAETLKEISG